MDSTECPLFWIEAHAGNPNQMLARVTPRIINLRPLLMQIKEEYGIPVDDWEKLEDYKGERIKVVRWESPVPSFHLHYRYSDIPGNAIASFDTFEKGGIYRIHIRETIPYQRGKTYNYKYDNEVKFYSTLKKQLKKRLDIMKAERAGAHTGNPGSKWKIIARHKWVSGATITESELEEDELPPGVTTVYRRLTATIRGWRGFRIFEGRMYPDVVKDVKAKVIEIRDRIDAGDESVFYESPLIEKTGIQYSNPDGTCATIREVLESECRKAKRTIEATEEFQREDVKVTWPFCEVLNYHFTKCSYEGNSGNPDGDPSARWIAKWERRRADWKRFNKPISEMKDAIISHKASLILGREFGEDPDAYIERRGLTDYYKWKDYEQWETYAREGNGESGEEDLEETTKPCIFTKEPVKPKEYFEPESFRTLCPQCPESRCSLCPPERVCATRIITGCKAGEFVKVRCQVPTEAHAIYHGRSESLSYNPGNPDEDLEEMTIIHRLEDNPDGNPGMREVERELAERGIIF